MELPFSAGLVSVIGQKGSGKSALAEVISYAAGSWQTEDPSSFIKRAGSHLQDLRVTLHWADGEDTDACLGEDQSGENAVRYLSQKFVERLCAEDYKGTELVRAIEAVVFSHIDPTETLNASSFDKLRSLRTRATREQGHRLREDINRLIEEEYTLWENFLKLGEKRGRIEALTKEREGLLNQLPLPATKEEADRQEDLRNKREALARIQRTIADEKQRLQTITDIRSKVHAFRKRIRWFVTELDTMLESAGIPEDERRAFRPNFPADTEGPLARRSEVLNQSIAQHQGAIENPAKDTLHRLEMQINALVEMETADKARQERIRVSQTRIAEIGTELKRVQDEIAQIEGPERKRLVEVGAERLEAYADYFSNLTDEQSTLEQLYEPVKARLASSTETPPEQDLEFSIRWEADLATWLEKGSVLFDQRRTLPYGTFGAMSAAADRMLVPAWTSGDASTIRPAMSEFLTEFSRQDLPPSRYLRRRVSINELFHWLFEVDHIRLTYSLKYNGVELEKLSPGTKGIVLLILYLGMDVGDTRPLIVDQPDENLDNESIYRLLTGYFRNAKSRRQIILITHNPNLVVNTDSEQVVVANCARRQNGLPHISYRSGALENNYSSEHSIREQVCRILEGGSDAFLRRERRYALVTE